MLQSALYICCAVTFCNQLRYSAEKAVVERSVPVGAEGRRGQVRHHLRQLAVPALQGFYRTRVRSLAMLVSDSLTH